MLCHDIPQRYRFYSIDHISDVVVVVVGGISIVRIPFDTVEFICRLNVCVSVFVFAYTASAVVVESSRREIRRNKKNVFHLSLRLLYSGGLRYSSDAK